MKRWFGIVLTLTACTPSSFGPSGYTHPSEQYRIVASSPTLLGSDWILDSHHGDDVDDLELKTGPAYEVTYHLDANGDGENDFENELPLYDLYWAHSADSSSIWMRSIPIPDRYFRKDPKILLLNYVERIAGSGFAFATYDDEVVAKAQRYGTKIVSSAPARLGQQPAHTVEIEVVNLDQLELDASTPRHRARLVLAHSRKWLPVGRRVEYNSVILAGYSARPEDFPKHKAVFEALLSKIRMGEPE